MTQPIRVTIAKEVLKVANAIDDCKTSTACRGIIYDWELGHKHKCEDYQIVLAFYAALQLLEGE